MPLKYFLFDLDGTLVDSIPDLTTAVNLLRAEFNLPSLSMEQVRGFVGDGVGLLVQRALPPELFSPDSRLRYMEIYAAHLTDETQIYPGIIDFLAMHRDKPMAVVTNKPQALAEIVVDRLGLKPFFREVIGAEAGLRKKPHPEMVVHALRRLGGRPNQAILFGDHHVDLRAAHAAGAKSCFCAWGLGHTENLTADYQALTATELPKLFPGESL